MCGTPRCRATGQPTEWQRIGRPHYDYDMGGKWLELLKQIAAHSTLLCARRERPRDRSAAKLG